MAKSVVKSVFSLHPLPVISSPKPPFFVHFGRFGGKIHLLRGISFFSALDFLAQNLILRRQKQFDEEFLLGVRPSFDFCRRGKRESRRFFHLTTDEAISKQGRFCPKTSTRTKKHKAITEKPKDKIKKQTYYTEKTKHNRARQIIFLSLPHSIRKIQADFLPNVPTFRDVLPCFISNLPTPHKIPFTLRAGHAPTRIYAPAHSANFPFLPSPFTLSHNKLYISLLSVKVNPAFTFTLTATT